MTKKVLVSVIVPVYNTEKTLKRCLESIVQQEYQNLEILLIDDGSTDNSFQICQNYAMLDYRIKVFSKPNGGLSSARNFGIDQATGEYICFIDSDDWIHSQYVSLLICAIRKYSCDIAACSYSTISSDGFSEQKYSFDSILMKKKEFMHLMFVDRSISVFAWNKLYKKSLFSAVKYPEGKLYEDIVPMFFLVDKVECVAVTHQKLYNYYYNPDSITNSNYKSKDEDYIEQWEIVAVQCKSKYPELMPDLDYRLLFSHFRLLNKIALSSYPVSPKDYEHHIQYLKKHWNNILKIPYFSFGVKMQLFILLFNWNFYVYIYRKLKYLKMLWYIRRDNDISSFSNL